MHFPEFTATAHDSPFHHLLAGIGSIWAVGNFAAFGVTLVTLVPPLLIGFGSIWAARNAARANRIAEERLAFDQRRYEDELRARLAAAAPVAPVVVAVAPPPA